MKGDIEIRSALEELAAKIPVCEMEDHAARLYEAPEFSTFNLLGNRETALSRVLAELLDPRGSHGQGALFLNAMLRLIGCKALQAPERNVYVQTEASVPVNGRQYPRRIDILVETPAILLGIENKKWTGESKDQLLDYWYHLKKKAGENQDYKLIFISNDKPPESVEAIRLPYYCRNDENSVKKWLQSVRQDIKAPRVRDFIDDFLGWIQREFSTEDADAMTPHQKMILNFLKSSPGNKKAIGAVLTSFKQIRRSYIHDVETYLMDGLKAEFSDIEFRIQASGAEGMSLDVCLESQHEWWTARRPHWPKNSYLALSSEIGDCKRIIYGLAALNPKSAEGRYKGYKDWACDDYENLSKSLASVSEGQQATDWWLWWRLLKISDWTIDVIGKAIISDEQFAGQFFDIKNVLNDLINIANAIDQAISQCSQ